MQRLAFRKIFNQFAHISYLLLISFTTKFELQKSNYFCGFNINTSEKKIILSVSLSLERNFVPYPCHTIRSGFLLFFKSVAFRKQLLSIFFCCNKRSNSPFVLYLIFSINISFFRKRFQAFFLIIHK